MKDRFKENSIRVMALIAVLALSVCLCAGCSRIYALIGVDDSVPRELDSDTVFTVGDRSVSISEWALYALAEEARITSLYGSRIWDIKINDELGTIADSMKRDIYDRIVFIKTVVAEAERLEVKLTEDDELDIEYLTDEYMERLSEAGKVTAGITRELVKNVYRDNLLAERVSEKIMLNVNTDIPDDEVRHMVLDYIVILKSYEDENGDIAYYTDEELEEISAGIEEYYEYAAGEIYGTADEDGADPDVSPEAGEYRKTLSELHTEEYVPATYIADYDELHDRFPYAIADSAYAMKTGELLGVLETEEAYYILFCEEEEDYDATNAARVEVIERRQKDIFEEQYREWEKKAVIRMNYEVWDRIEVR